MLAKHIEMSQNFGLGGWGWNFGELPVVLSEGLVK
jgi:hypothetical protein